MTNKEKALELIKAETYEADCSEMSSFETVDKETIQEAIDLASKSDWYYPSRNELPDSGEYFVTNEGLPAKMLDNDKYKCLVTNSIGSIYSVDTWVYLPKF